MRPSLPRSDAPPLHALAEVQPGGSSPSHCVAAHTACHTEWEAVRLFVWNGFGWEISGMHVLDVEVINQCGKPC